MTSRTLKEKEPVKFRIHRADGSRVPTLKNAFVTKRLLSDLQLSSRRITLDDGTEWQLVVEDSETKERILADGLAYCIVSFQAHEHGNYAVAKLVKPKVQ